MQKSKTMKFLIILVLVFFILSTGLMFVLYLASPDTVLELEGDENMPEAIEEVDPNNEEAQDLDQEVPEEFSLEGDMIEN